jgi:hypothetical protein
VTIIIAEVHNFIHPFGAYNTTKFISTAVIPTAFNADALVTVIFSKTAFNFPPVFATVMTAPEAVLILKRAIMAEGTASRVKVAACSNIFPVTGFNIVTVAKMRN